jgi:hypothetical protein
MRKCAQESLWDFVHLRLLPALLTTDVPPPDTTSLCALNKL